MKIVLKLITIFFLFISCTQAQELLLEKVIGYQNDDILFETIELNDGSYLSLGWTKSIGNGQTDFFLIKSNQNGDKLWEKTFGGFDLETGISVKEFANGNLLLSGTTRSFGSGLGDCIFIITDSNGNKINEFYYGSFGDDYLRESIITHDNNIVFAGYSNSFGNGMKDIIIGKIDLNAELVWVMNYGGSKEDEGWHISQTQDGGYIVSGFITNGNSSVHSKNIKVDHNGQIIWEYDRLQRKVEYGINYTLEDQNGDFLSAHTIQNTNTGKSQIEVYRISKSGQLLSSKIFESDLNSEFRSMVKTNCGYAFAFSTWDQRNRSDISIIFTDEELNETKNLKISKPEKDDAWKTTYKNSRIIVSGSITNSINNSLDGIFAVIDVGNCNQENIECVNIKISDDAAIGYHDFFNTSSTNFGNAIQNAAYVIPGALGGININRALLSFDLNQVQNLSSIVSAKINLFAIGPLGTVSGHEGNNESVLQRIIQPWSEFSATWDNQPQTTSMNEITLQKSTSSTQDYVNIDITPLINDLIINDNYGIMLKLKEENIGNVLFFYSSDYFDTQKHPTLDVCYAIVTDTFFVSNYSEVKKCEDEEIILQGKTNSQWSNGETGQFITVSSEGYFVSQAFINDTLYIDSFYVQHITVPTLDLGEDIATCELDTFLISVNDEFQSYLWSTSETGHTLEITIPGEYWLEAIDQCDNIVRDTLKVVALSSDTTFISKYLIPGESIFVNNIQFDTPGNFVINLLNRFDCDSIVIVDINSANSLVYYDFNKCIALVGSSNMDYSEFTPQYTSQLSCMEVTASIAYRENGSLNKHSCTSGINNSLAMCISSLNSCDYKAGDEKSIKINLFIEPKNDEYFQLQGLSFFTKAPDMFDWINGDKGLNNYPTKFGIRILQNGNEIFSKTNLSTNQDWKKEIFNFMDNNKFLFQEKTQLTLEILPYCLVGNLSNESAWDVDDFTFYGICVPKQSINMEGKVLSISNQPILETVVYITDISSEVKKVETSETGSYTYNIKDIKGKYTIQPENNNRILDGVTTLDLLIIQRHILGSEPFQTAEQYVAADIDNNKKVSASDLVELKKNILGIKNEFKNNQSWRFNQKSFQTKIENPFEIKEKIEYTYIINQPEELNFNAIKIGDLSNLTFLNNTEPRSTNHLEIKYNIVNRNGKYFVEVYCSAISDIYGLEFNVNLDKLLINDIIPSALELSMDDFSVNGSNLKISKIFDKSISFGDNDLLFTIMLNKSFPILNDHSFEGEVYADRNLKIIPISLKYLNLIQDNDINLTSIYPNPFKNITNLVFETEYETNLMLHIFDESGKFVSKNEYVINKTNNQIVLDHSFFEINPGIYFIQIISKNINQIYKVVSVY